MGKGYDSEKLIKNDYTRKVTFKKRRIGLVKKAMQLAIMSGCQVSLKVFFEEDGSLIEYFSHEDENISSSDKMI